MTERMFDQDIYSTPYWQAFEREDGTVRIHTATPYGSTSENILPDMTAFHSWKRTHYRAFGEVETGGHAGGTLGGGLRNERFDIKSSLFAK